MRRCEGGNFDLSQKHRVWFLDGISPQDRYVYAEILFSAYCGCPGTGLSREASEIWSPATGSRA